jgi:hypothetical protein
MRQSRRSSNQGPGIGRHWIQTDIESDIFTWLEDVNDRKDEKVPASKVRGLRYHGNDLRQRDWVAILTAVSVCYAHNQQPTNSNISNGELHCPDPRSRNMLEILTKRKQKKKRAETSRNHSSSQ